MRSRRKARSATCCPRRSCAPSRCVSAIVLLFYNLSKLQGQGGVVYVIVAMLLIILPLGGWWLAGRIAPPTALLQQQQSMVANALVDSLTTPQEVQLMNAGPLRSATACRAAQDASRSAAPQRTAKRGRGPVPAGGPDPAADRPDPLGGLRRRRQRCGAGGGRHLSLRAARRRPDPGADHLLHEH